LRVHFDLLLRSEVFCKLTTVAKLLWKRHWNANLRLYFFVLLGPLFCSQALSRSITFRRQLRYLAPHAIQCRKAYLVDAFKQGKYLKNAAPKEGDNPMGQFGSPPDPAGMEVMMEGMKKNMAMIVPQTIIMSLINSFFSGFLLST
jgi:hypothetical protein